ncbi:MAG: NUDIX hydrolase [Candidatus Woesebacteria bacterium]
MNTFNPSHTSEKVFARVGAKTIIQNREGKILVLRRSEKCSRPGGWDFPGGASDWGENPRDTVIRETREETGLEIKDPTMLTIYSSVSEENEYIVQVGFAAKIQAGEVLLSWEHDLFEWITVEAALTCTWPGFHKQLLQKFS